ncbi:hypothetical protein JCM11491_003177 [Sporobolomyces phaffii]
MSTAPQLSQVSLADLATPGFELLPTHLFAGKILAPQPRDSTSDAYRFTLAAIDGSRASVRVEIGERVASNAQIALQQDTKVALLGGGGRIWVYRANKDGKPRVKVVYEDRVEGWRLERDGTAKEGNRFIWSTGEVAPCQTVAKEARSPDIPATVDRAVQATNRMKDAETQTEKGTWLPRHDLCAGAPLPLPRGKSRAAIAKSCPSPSAELDSSSDIEILSRQTKCSFGDQGGDAAEEAEGQDLEPPGSYNDLDEISKGGLEQKSVNIIVKIESVKSYEPRNVGKDYYTELLVSDPSCTNECMIQWYVKTAAQVPKFKQGAILVVKGLDVSKPNKLKKNGNKSVNWVFLEPSKLIQGANPEQLPRFSYYANLHYSTSKGTVETGATITRGECDYAVKIAKDALAATSAREKPRPAKRARQDSPVTNVGAPGRSNAGGPVKTGGKPVLEIKDLEAGRFCNTWGEIRKIYSPETDGPVSLHITDYTTNLGLVNWETDAAERHNFPPGRQTLQVSLFGIQARPLFSKGPRAQIGDFVRIDNLRPKINPEGLLEATLYDDQRFKDKLYLSLFHRTKESKKMPQIARILAWVRSLDRYPPSNIR